MSATVPASTVEARPDDRLHVLLPRPRRPGARGPASPSRGPRCGSRRTSSSTAGHPGVATLRDVLRLHRPGTPRTEDELEEAFPAICDGERVGPQLRDAERRAAARRG